MAIEETIVGIIARHDKKDANAAKRQFAGDSIDSDLVPLSKEGEMNAEATGKIIKGTDKYRYIITVSSDHLRCRMTRDGFLKGMGYNPQELMQQPDKARFIEDSILGLGGARWEYPDVPKISDVPAELKTYVQAIISRYFLKREDALENTTEDKRGQVVLAQRALAISDAFMYGVNLLSNFPAPKGQKDLILISTHSPLIDAFAAWYSNRISASHIPDVHIKEEWNKRVAEITVEEGKPYIQGNYIRIGVTPQNGENPDSVLFTFNDGNTSKKDMPWFTGRRRELANLAVYSTQRVK